jgi:diguanylate cyclase (GGDEF)-like protein
MDNNRKIALKAALVYLIAGVLWILITDTIMVWFVNNKEVIAWVSIAKGWVFVALSALLVYMIGLFSLKKLEEAKTDLLKANDEILRDKDKISTSYNELLKMKKKLHDMAYFDQLTGLKNYQSLMEDISGIISKNKKFALIYADIDNFKYANDTLGHAFGNKVIKAISGLLAGLMEENCLLYRIGGDKFVILQLEGKGMAELESFAVKILKGIKNPIIADDKTFFYTVSLGVAMFPEHGSDLAEIMMCAEIALIKAKESGKNRIVIYSEPMKTTMHEWIDTEKYLRSALMRNEFELYFQPQMEVGSNRISGFEALIRWRNDEMGFVMPSKFLKVAEDTHMIIQIGEWVLRNACIFIKRLQQEGFTDKIVSVNVSGLQILQDDFVDNIMECIELADIDPAKLEIEVSEYVLMDMYDIAAEKLSMLKQHGISIAIDNFGKGYSALNYLHKLPATTIKIDRMYSDIISFGENSRMLTEFMVRIGKSANLCIVGEGVETKEQFDYLAALGCNRLQGYFVSRPLPEKEAIRKLRDNTLWTGKDIMAH